MGMCMRIAMTKELKKMAFKISNQNIKQNKPRLERFLAKYDGFFGDLCVHFEPLLGCECAYVCHD